MIEQETSEYHTKI
jgi:hypothetical protein